ncbi:MAG: hypothetical protein SGI74_01800 [Oligoflexia bacterium]|nr:hypothetical protein [Oligoflexia bacterium]
MRLLLICSCFLIINCSSKPCNNIPQRPEPSPTPVPTSDGAYVVPNTVTKTEEKRLPSINVYKGTGELQCGAGKAIPIEDMQHTLTTNKITIYESKTRLDGLMHIALCGSPTGKIHVFTIAQQDLKKAQKLGFKELKKP